MARGQWCWNFLSYFHNPTSGVADQGWPSWLGLIQCCVVSVFLMELSPCEKNKVLLELFLEAGGGCQGGVCRKQKTKQKNY